METQVVTAQQVLDMIVEAIDNYPLTIRGVMEGDWKFTVGLVKVFFNLTGSVNTGMTDLIIEVNYGRAPQKVRDRLDEIIDDLVVELHLEQPDGVYREEGSSCSDCLTVDFINLPSNIYTVRIKQPLPIVA